MKKDHVKIPKPSSVYQKVNCTACDETQVTYSHATTIVMCNSCGNVLTTPTGSKSTVNGRILESIE